MKKCLILLLLVSTTVFGEWTKTGIGDDSSIYVDMSTIKRSGDVVRVTYLQNFSLGTTTEDKTKTFKSTKTIEDFDCKKKQSKTISFE